MNTIANENNEKWALVVEGGAMRGIFSTGVLDSFIKEAFNPFELCIGVSAGATNLAAYLAGMYKRNHEVYMTYSLDKEFISLKKYLRGGHYMDLDWMWRETIEAMRLDLNQIVNGPSQFLVGLTAVETGEAIFVQPTVDNLEEVIKASSALPVVYRHPVIIDGVPYADGGISAPIPVDEAIKRGYKKIMVIRSRKKDYVMRPKKMILEPLLLKKMPLLLKAVKDRPIKYNASIMAYRNMPSDIEVIEVTPQDSFSTDRFTKDTQILEKDYRMGRQIGLELVKSFANKKPKESAV